MSDEVVVERARWSIAPYFIVNDVVTTANYYRDTLGFRYERFLERAAILLHGPSKWDCHHAGSARKAGGHETQSHRRSAR